LKKYSDKASSIREPVVAGQFYSSGKTALLGDLKSLIVMKKEKEDAIGMISPHAGYVYSGGVAGALFGSIKTKAKYVIMGPNHSGLGKPFGISSAKSWRTPLGEAEIDRRLADAIEKNCKYVQDDDLSHSGEHSIEVELPFLQYLEAGFAFVPITISQADLDTYRKIGIAVARSIRDLGIEKQTSLIASSDMTHYESRDAAEKKDSSAIEAILKLDEEMLYMRVASMNITMCGYAPAIIAIVASKELGAKRANLVKYATSGDASGDYSSVVGYAAITIS
jgi:MEMO1 family protein